jgi:hypothetical protein
VQRLKKWSTTAEKVAIEDRRRKLETRISNFHKRVYDIMVSDDDEELVVRQVNNDRGSEDEETSDEDEEASDEEEDDSSDDEENEPESPENIPICMPSSIETENNDRESMKVLFAQEIELRIGQANDSLRDLRVALGHKALLFRVKVRKAKTTKGKTKSWDELKLANIQVAKKVRAYRRARSALERLGADATVLHRYKPIKKDDLLLNKDLTEENRYGQRNDVLPWFWMLDGQPAGNQDSWMEECENINFPSPSPSHPLLEQSIG